MAFVCDYLQLKWPGKKLEFTVLEQQECIIKRENNEVVLHKRIVYLIRKTVLVNGVIRELSLFFRWYDCIPE